MAEGDSSYQTSAQQSGEMTEAQQWLQGFWQKTTDQIRDMKQNDFKSQELPLARIKKIMKLDEDVKMISQEAPLLFSKAAEIFISELSLRAWSHTEDNKRRTLQRNDIAMAISKYDQFDFLIDIVPRDVDQGKPPRRADGQPAADAAGAPGTFYFQMPAQQAAAGAAAATAQQTIQMGTGQPAAATAAASQVIQVAAPPGQAQTIQLSAEQLAQIQQQMARGTTNEPIVIQATASSVASSQSFTTNTQNQQVQFVQQQQPASFIQQTTSDQPQQSV